MSGIITERLDEVLSALKENNIKVESISEKEGLERYSLHLQSVT